jgi:hypothetical protein
VSIYSFWALPHQANQDSLDPQKAGTSLT